MFRIGKVINCYEKIGVTIVELFGSLTVGDRIKIYKDGECILTQRIDQIVMDQKSIPFAKHKDVIALVLDEKVQKGSEVFRLGELGVRS